jgi:predicted DNA binding CopG/RHH family protein
MRKQPAELIVKTTVRLPKSLADAVKHRSIDEGLNFQQLLILALERYLGFKGGR